MPNMSKAKVAMPEQDPKKRSSNFSEVSMGYTLEMAIEEADRCIDCKNKPCVTGCPVSVRIPEFIMKIRQGDIPAAYDIIKSTNSLPAVCGRVCPQEVQCEQVCTRGLKGEPVAIGRLERFAADYMRNLDTSCDLSEAEKKILINGHKVAVVGAGPAGLTCAGDLARIGYGVTIFEAFHVAGGVLMYGIPEFRLPKEVVKYEIAQLESLGVKIMTNMVIGKVLSLDELFEMGYEAVFVGSGAGLPNFMGIPGENLVGVFSANEFLTRVNLMKAHKNEYDTPISKFKNVAVVGGGNVTMDAARCAKRFGTEHVYILYRRSEQEMPARLEEIHHAKEEGVELITLAGVTEIKGDSDGRVTSVVCQRMELGEPDASGRRSPVPKDGDFFEINVDAVIMAIGNSPNHMITDTTAGLECNRRGGILAADNMQTSRKGVFAGGDAVTGAATVILAMGAGKTAAAAIDEYIKSL